MDSQKTGKDNLFSLYWPRLELLLFLATDEAGDGNLTDYLWLRADKRKKEDSLFFFNEFLNPKTKLPMRRLWYAPDNKKLIEWEDADGNEIWERKTYFNANATPKNFTQYIARVDFDIDQDGNIDYSWFPGIRWEKFSPIHRFEGSRGEIPSDAVQMFLKTKDTKFLSPFITEKESKSWTLHPERIAESRYRATFQP